MDEAARLLRVGRTKAYAMAKQWRQTGGRAGLPVIDLGDVLRVPVRALDQLIEDALRAQPNADTAALADPEPTVQPGPKPKRTRRHRQASADQPALFDTPNPAA